MCVFGCCLIVVMVSAVGVVVGSSFLQRGAERVKGLEHVFMPRLFTHSGVSSLIPFIVLPFKKRLLKLADKL